MFLILLLILLLRWSVWSHHKYLKGHFTYFLSCSVTNTAVVDHQSIVLISALNQLNECKTDQQDFSHRNKMRLTQIFCLHLILKLIFHNRQIFISVSFTWGHFHTWTSADYDWLLSSARRWQRGLGRTSTPSSPHGHMIDSWWIDWTDSSMIDRCVLCDSSPELNRWSELLHQISLFQLNV